jgi:hypothetical protein
VGLGSLSGGGVLIAGGGAGCTDCFQDDAESVGGSLLAILGIDSITNPDSRPQQHISIVVRGFIPDGQRSCPKDF